MLPILNTTENLYPAERLQKKKRRAALYALNLYLDLPPPCCGTSAVRVRPGVYFFLYRILFSSRGDLHY